MDGRQVVGQIQAQMFTNHAHSCPNCGQQNVKVRDASLDILDSNEIVKNSRYHISLYLIFIAKKKMREKDRRVKWVLN